MKAHIVQNGVVVNTVNVLELGPGMIDGSVGGKGDLWDGVTLTPGPKRVRQEVDSWKFKLALQKAGHYAAANAGITGANDLIRWNFKPTIRRGDGLTAEIKQVLGISNDAMDDLFNAARGD